VPDRVPAVPASRSSANESIVRAGSGPDGSNKVDRPRRIVSRRFQQVDVGSCTDGSSKSIVRVGSCPVRSRRSIVRAGSCPDTSNKPIVRAGACPVCFGMSIVSPEAYRVIDSQSDHLAIDTLLDEWPPECSRGEARGDRGFQRFTAISPFAVQLCSSSDIPARLTPRCWCRGFLLRKWPCSLRSPAASMITPAAKRVSVRRHWKDLLMTSGFTL
jgi:hypothetical protein